MLSGNLQQPGFYPPWKEPVTWRCRVKAESRKGIFSVWLKPSVFKCLLVLFGVYRTPFSPLPPMSSPAAATVRLPLRFHGHSSWNIPLFYSDTPFFFSRSRQARSCGFVCRPMYVSSPCQSGTAAFGRTLAINSKTGSASYRNQYEWITFSDEFPVKSNHISSCKFMEQLPLFPKVSVADSQIPSLPINSRIFLFLHAQKAYSWINYLLPSYPIKNIRIFLFLLYTKSVFVHFFMVTT